MSQVDQRERILRRLRRYLEEQRTRFVNYLHLLDQQAAAIRGGDVDRIRHHVELEQGIIGGIETLQRAINPLKELYRQACSRAGEPERRPETVDSLEVTLQSLRDQALTRNRENQGLLRERLESLRLEIKDVARRGKPNPSPFTRIGEPKLVDLRS